MAEKMAEQIKLISLAFSFFKGLQNYTLLAEGQDVDIYGNNAVGKTTLFDGFCWLLFHKDSRDKGEPEKWIKTLDSAGVPMHGVEHEVVGVLEIDGQRRELRKVFTEKWTKKRGAAKAEFTGHKTDYYIDGAPYSMSDYNAEIGKIIDEVTFKLLTNPSYFAELDWKKRRKLLLDVCGDISDTDVISSNSALAELPALLENRSLDGHRDKIKGDQARINSKLKDIPGRIAEVQNIMPDTDGLDEEMMRKQIEALRERINNKEEELARIQNGGEIAVKTNRLREIDGELLEIKNKIQAGSLDKIQGIRQEISKKRGQASQLEDSIRRAEHRISSLRAQIEENEGERSQLRAERDRVRASEFTFDGDDSCPSCGQALPMEQIEEARRRAEERFNAEKADRLETIVTRGKRLKQLAEQWAVEIESLSEEIEASHSNLDSLKGEAQELEAKVGEIEATVSDVTTAPAYTAKLQEREEVNQSLVELRSRSVGTLNDIRLELTKLRSELALQEKKLAGFEQVQKAQGRIEELKTEERELARQYEELERQLYLTEEFTRTKVQMLESKINAKFKQVKFRLFEIQVNGALNETCKILYGPNLVPYDDGLNRAAQVNAGLDIINTLSEHYGVVAPIFIDNAEAMTRIVETAGQQIRLIVSKDHPQLHCELKQSIVQEELF